MQLNNNSNINNSPPLELQLNGNNQMKKMIIRLNDSDELDKEIENIKRKIFSRLEKKTFKWQEYNML